MTDAELADQLEGHADDVEDGGYAVSAERMREAARRLRGTTAGAIPYDDDALRRSLEALSGKHRKTFERLGDEEDGR